LVRFEWLHSLYLTFTSVPSGNVNEGVMPSLNNLR